MLIKIGVDIGTVSWEGLRSLTFDNLNDDIVPHTMKFGLPLYISRVGNIFKVDIKARPNAKNMRIYCMNLWKKRWMQYSTHVKSYEQKCVQPYMRRYSPLRIKSSHSGLDLRSRGKILHRLCCAWSNSDRVVDDSKLVRCLFWLFWGKTGKLAPLFVW